MNERIVRCRMFQTPTRSVSEDASEDECVELPILPSAAECAGSLTLRVGVKSTAWLKAAKQWHGLSVIGGCWFWVLIANVSASAATPAQKPMLEAATVAADTSVRKRLGTVEDYLSDKRWAEAADILHEIAQSEGRSLVKAQPGQAGTTAVYLNVATRCQVLLSRMPTEGLIAYRRKVDPLAKRWFENWQRTGDRSELERLVRQAYLSSFGDDALWSLGEAAWDRGDFATARLFWSQIVALPEEARAANLPTVLRYPDSDLDPATVLSRLVLCSLMDGNRVRAFEEQQRFEQLYPQAVGTLAGKQGRLAELLKQVLEESVTWDAPPHADEAATFGLAPERTQTLPAVIDVGAPRWKQPLTPNLLRHLERPRSNPDRGPLSTHPVVFRDLVLVNDADSISAFHLLTGDPAWPTERGTAQIYPPAAVERAAAPDRLSVGVPWFTMTVADGKLFARLGSPVSGPSGTEPRDLDSDLVCLDLANGEGRLVWKISANEWPHDGEQSWRFEGSPVVHAGRAYMIHSRRRPQLEFALTCLDAANGERLWTRPLATSRTTIEDHHNRVSHLLPTFGAGKLFVSTDAGAIVAVEAQSGRIEWAVTYESRLPGDFADQSDHAKQGLVPAMFHEGLVFVAPNDCDRLFCIEADSGRVRWQKPHPARDRWRHLLGVVSSDSGSKLVISGHSLRTLDVETGREGWRVLASNDITERGYGRGVLAGDAVLWPTREGLQILDAASGQPRRNVPLNTPDSAESGGNVLVAGGMLLIAQSDKLVAYGEYSLLKERLHRDLSSRSDKSLMLFKLAEIEAAAGNLDAATKALRTARQLDSGASPARDVSDQQHLARLGELLRRAALKRSSQGHTDEAIAGLNEALALATEPADRARVLFDLAAVEQARQRPEAAVEHWQHILDDPQLRTAVRRESVGETTAGNEATAAIGRLLTQHGRAAYASVEPRASQEITSRMQARDTAGLRAALAQFPHSEVVRRARFTLAALECNAGQIQSANSIFARLVDEGVTPAEQATALVAWAEALEAAGYWRGSHRVWQRLNEARFAHELVDHGGGTRRAYELARERLTRPEYHAYEAVSPEPISFLERAWTVNLASKGKAVAAENEAQLMPFVPQGEPPSQSLACVIVHRGGDPTGGAGRRLDCLDRESGHVRWQQPCSATPRWVAYAETHLLIAADDELSALTLESGRLLWSVALRSGGPAKSKHLSANSPLAPALRGEGPGVRGSSIGPKPFVQLQTRDHWVIEFEPQSGVRLIDARTGETAWSFQPPGQLERNWSCSAKQIALQTIQPATTWLLEIGAERRVAELTGHSEPWRRLPVIDDAGRVTVVTDTRRVECLAPQVASPAWTFRGGMSSAHTDPVAWTSHQHLLLTIDGTTLTDIHRETGRVLWSAGLTDWPLIDPVHQVVANDTTVFVASRGCVRAISLNNGQRLWEQFVGDETSAAEFANESSNHGQWNVAACGSLVAAWPMAPTGSTPQTGSAIRSVWFCAADSGRIVQRCQLPAKAKKVSVAGDSSGTLVVTDRGIIAFRPRTPMQTAHVQ